MFDRMRATCDRLVLVVYSGRPLVIPELLAAADAVVAAWLPGTEATELPQLLMGTSDFEGQLTQPWPGTAAHVGERDGSYLYPIGHRVAANPGGQNR